MAQMPEIPAQFHGLRPLMENPEQLHLRPLHRFAESDSSDVSLQTERSDGFAGTRQSSISAEPMTLDAEQMHDAKDEAIDVLEKTDPEEASDVFTKDLRLNDTARSDEVEARHLANQLERLVQRTALVVEANKKQAQATSKIPGAPNEEKAHAE